ncbi:reverse transcriptase [Trichonephila clavipes]|nr:reverse transcriptase [Trichonephila clavipes]
MRQISLDEIKLIKISNGSFAVGKKATNYDGEVLAVCEATTHLLSAGLDPAKAVFFIDSQVAILAKSSNTPTDRLNTIQCRTKIAGLVSYGWTATLQCVPSHVEILGNERAEIKKPNRERSRLNRNLRRPWETLATVGPILRRLGRAEAVTLFRLTTGRDFLGVHLHWLGVAANEAYPLCGHARMDGDHLPQCTGLAAYPTDDIISRYWEARRQTVKKPSMGVG